MIERPDLTASIVLHNENLKELTKTMFFPKATYSTSGCLKIFLNLRLEVLSIKNNFFFREISKV